MQVAVPPLGRLEPAGEPLETRLRVVEDELDRVHVLGGATGGRAAVTDKLSELRAQCGMQVLHESHGDTAALAWCQAQSPICSDGDLDATAEHLVITAGVGPAVAPPDQRMAGPDVGLGSWFEDCGQAWRWCLAVEVRAFASVVLLPSHMRSKPQLG